jgi:glycosyltransferase involved in cell wall biosynthesis
MAVIDHEFTAEPSEGQDTPPIERVRRIRTGHSYPIYFTIALGQRNAAFVERALTPLARIVRWADAVTFVPEPGFEAIHSFNAVPLLTRRPYIVTFEDFLPRTPQDRRIPWLERVLRERLLDRRCVGLVALSEYAVRQVCRQHEGWPRLPELRDKIQVIYPVCAPRRDRPKPHSDRLRLLFVGRDFMRKGGPVLIRAHSELRRRGVPVETTVVSSLQWSAADYVGPPDARYVENSSKGLAQEDLIHLRTAPLKAVYEMMDKADYLVLPTFHDTFGYVTIEALAGGTPVIATDTCALPEIIRPGINGYLLPFENDPWVGKWKWLYCQDDPGYLDAYHATTERLSVALADRLTATWDARGAYEALSEGALAAANSRFHPQIACRELEALYERFRDA